MFKTIFSGNNKIYGTMSPGSYRPVSKDWKPLVD